MRRQIVKFPSPVLRKKAKAVKRLTPQVLKLIDQMIEIMRAAPGIGLAAPQIGEPLRLIVADIGAGEIVLANPKIMARQGRQTFTEGCLSLPGVEAPVERAARVTVKGLSRDGQAITIEAESLLATVLQHEIDHLDGRVFIDRVKDPSLIKHVAFSSEKKEDLI